MTAMISGSPMTEVPAIPTNGTTLVMFMPSGRKNIVAMSGRYRLPRCSPSVS